MTMSVPVSLGERSYHIHIGGDLLKKSGELLAPHLSASAKARPIPIVTDETVFKLHYPAFAAGLAAANLTGDAIVLSPGEQTKSFAGLERLSGELLSRQVERGGLIVALGGGVIGDLTGFAAGILKRGIDFAQVPTTLLAQVDSSVGGKTAINTPQGKNLVGLFYQPKVVIADTTALATLPKRELLAGYAEVVKYGLLGDAEFFAWLEKNGVQCANGDTQALAHAVAHSCAMKAAIVARDERETGDRALLNLGHTFGHALETATGYSNALLHGEGVGLGCILAFKLSARLGLCSLEDVRRTRDHFAAVGMKTSIRELPGGKPATELLLTNMRHDKKAKDGQMVFILARGLGKAFITNDVPEAAVRELLDAE